MGLAAGFVFAILPTREGAFVNAQEFPAIGGFDLEVETPLLDVFAEVPGIGRIQVRFP